MLYDTCPRLVIVPAHLRFANFGSAVVRLGWTRRLLVSHTPENNAKQAIAISVYSRIAWTAQMQCARRSDPPPPPSWQRTIKEHKRVRCPPIIVKPAIKLVDIIYALTLQCNQSMITPACNAFVDLILRMTSNESRVFHASCLNHAYAYAYAYRMCRNIQNASVLLRYSLDYACISNDCIIRARDVLIYGGLMHLLGTRR